MTKILSEARKYRLHLGLAHQTVTQLEGERLKGALENAKIKIMFNCGRDTAEAVVKQVFLPDTEKVKHRVPDEDAQQRSHPLFTTLNEQEESAVQEIMRLKKRRIVVKLPESDELYRLKTPHVPHPHINWKELSQIKDQLCQQSGRPIDELEERYSQRVTFLSNRIPQEQPKVKQPYDFWHS